MASSSRPVQQRKAFRRRILIGGVVLFLLIDAGLVWLAFNNPRISAAPDTSEITFPDPQPSETQPTPLPAVTSAPSLVAPKRIIAARDASIAWRVSTGQCPSTITEPERTVDAGASWKKTSATKATGVVAAQRLVPEGRDVLSLVGSDPADCSAMFVRTFVAGDNYRSYPAELPNSWFVDPKAPGNVHTPQGDRASPCSHVIALDAEKSRVVILCDTGESYASIDAARTWSDPVTVPAAVNVALSAAGFWVASVGAEDCAGVKISHSGANENPVAGCFLSPNSASSLAGEVAMSEAEGMLWVWVGDEVKRTVNGGRSWQ